MKKALAVSLIGTIMVLMLAACGSAGDDLTGTYESKKGAILTFSAGNKMELDLGGYKMQGTYEIKDGLLYTNLPEMGGKTDNKYTLEGKKLTVEGDEYFKK